MAIVAQDESTYARLSFNVGPGSQILIPIEVDYSRDFGPSDHNAWDCEYEANVTAVSWLNQPTLPDQRPAAATPAGVTGLAPLNNLLDEFERMDPIQRQLILDELADRPELWSGEEVIVI